MQWGAPACRETILVVARRPDGKFKVTSKSWDDGKVILPGQILEIWMVGGRLRIARKEKRRVYLVGKALGQTNVYFFGVDGRQITGLDIAVTSSSQQGALENYPFPANVVQVFNGSKGQTLSCTPLACIDAAKPGSDQPPGTQNINVTGSTSSVSVGSK